MEVKVKWRQDREFRIKMQNLAKKLENTAPVMKSIGIAVHGWVLKNFAADGGLLKDGKWPPLASSTIASRRKGSSKPLQDTPKYKSGWNYQHTNKLAIIGHPSEIAVYHEMGTGLYGPRKKKYLIKPKGKKALRFVVSGFTVGKYGKAAKRSRLNYAFAKYVHHPGIRQRRQLPTEDEIWPTVNKTLDVWLKKVTQ